MLFCLLLFSKSIICLGSIECCSDSCCLENQLSVQEIQNAVLPPVVLLNQLSVQEVENAGLPHVVQKINYLFRKQRMLVCLMLFRKSIICLGSIECCSASCCLENQLSVEVQNAVLPPVVQKINYLFRKYRMLFCLMLLKKINYLFRKYRMLLCLMLFQKINYLFRKYRMLFCLLLFSKSII